jgi:hypothetical protein
MKPPLKGVPANNKSGIKGVVWRNDFNRWSAKIKTIHLGLFKTKEEAAAAYAAKARQLFGGFARP